MEMAGAVLDWADTVKRRGAPGEAEANARKTVISANKVFFIGTHRLTRGQSFLSLLLQV
jgi:formylglycine-generating enzyme required for sulfatase activity